MLLIHSNTLRSLIAYTAIGLVLVGCSSPTMHSIQVSPNTAPTNPSDVPSSGLAYYLPKGFVHVVGDLQPPANQLPAYYKLTIAASIVADPTKLFVLTPNESIWAHDTYGISVQNGLLSSIGSTNADQLHDVLVSLAGLAGTLVLSPSKLPVAAPPLVPPVPKQTRVHFEVDIDPERGTWDDTPNSGLKITVTPSGPNYAVQPWSFGLGNDFKGVLYRPLSPFTVQIDDSSNAVTYTEQVLLPAADTILSLVPQRSPLIPRTANITFDHGTVTSFSLDKPSQAAAWAALPLDMLKAFLSVPTEMLQLKLNLSSTNNALNEARLKSLQDQLAILQAQAGINQFLITNALPKK